MEGLQILNSYIGVAWAPFHWNWLALLAIIPIGIAVILFRYVACENHSISFLRFWEGVAMTVVCVILSVVIVLVSCSHRQKYEYTEAIIGNEVGYLELTQKYDIVEQRGNIYLLRAKGE